MKLVMVVNMDHLALVDQQVYQEEKENEEDLGETVNAVSLALQALKENLEGLHLNFVHQNFPFHNIMFL